MPQYYPAYRTQEFPELSRRITGVEFRQAMEWCSDELRLLRKADQEGSSEHSAAKASVPVWLHETCNNARYERYDLAAPTRSCG
jgi:hypothetical protein